MLLNDYVYHKLHTHMYLHVAVLVLSSKGSTA